MRRVTHEWLDTIETRAEMAAACTLPIDDLLALTAAARNGLRPRLLSHDAISALKNAEECLSGMIGRYGDYGAGEVLAQIRKAIEP